MFLYIVFFLLFLLIFRYRMTIFMSNLITFNALQGHVFVHLVALQQIAIETERERVRAFRTKRIYKTTFVCLHFIWRTLFYLFIFFLFVLLFALRKINVFCVTYYTYDTWRIFMQIFVKLNDVAAALFLSSLFFLFSFFDFVSLTFALTAFVGE